jgi:hypothetical protein
VGWHCVAGCGFDEDCGFVEANDVAGNGCADDVDRRGSGPTGGDAANAIGT